MAIAKDEYGEIYAFQVFIPSHHGLQEISNKDYVDAEWYKLYDLDREQMERGEGA